MGGTAAGRTGDDTGPRAGETARDPDFSGHATGELERVRRDLAMSAALAVPGWGAHEVAVRQIQAIDAELTARRHREPGQEGAPMAGARRGPSEADVGNALEALRGDWGGFYAICYDQSVSPPWQAWRLGRIGVMVAGETPDELAAAIRADWGTWSAR